MDAKDNLALVKWIAPRKQTDTTLTAEKCQNLSAFQMNMA
jgi:hypothetical protein